MVSTMSEEETPVQEEVQAQEEPAVEEQVEAPPATSAPAPEPVVVVAAPPGKASKKEIDYADPRRPLLWKAWGVGVKCTEEEKTALVRELATKMKKEGLKESFAVRADCVIFACMTKDEGLVVYDCKATRKATA